MENDNFRFQNIDTNEWVKETQFGEAVHTTKLTKALTFTDQLKADSLLESLNEYYGGVYVIVHAIDDYEGELAS